MRAVTVHGHFYQPPRENPWLESVQREPSAYPYHDWNERVTDECYRRNAASRILDDPRTSIVEIVNNYARMSFNVGPTLLSWMRAHAPDVYRAVLEADAESLERFGHGSAMAQAYNHVIMPLANERDRRTQVRWGIADFTHRFGRAPTGMWLPETAVDVATLEVLAEHDISFTVLAPHQAARIVPDGDAEARAVDAQSVDTSRPYRVDLPSGDSIAVFFYDGPMSRAVAFDGLLQDGAALADRLAGAPLSDDDADGGLVHIATDGESYGHHHRHGDMALAYAMRRLEDRDDVVVTNYAAYLAAHPPDHAAQIHDETSWSCAHGVERWRSDCGCADGGHPDWNQAWRAPLREALDDLRDRLAERFEEAGARHLRDPWQARDDYIDVVLDRSPEARDAFLSKHANGELDEAARTDVWQLLEMQRHAMLMYTSCGWFFDDLGRIETVQVLRYAARAVQLGESLFGPHFEAPFLDRLEQATSNVPARGNGCDVYERHVRPAIADDPSVVAQHAIRSLFEPRRRHDRVGAYRVSAEWQRHTEAGDAQLAAARVRVTSSVTQASGTLEYAVVHLGDHNVDARVREAGDDEELAAAWTDVTASFAVGDLPATIRRLDEHFPPPRFTLRDLFPDGQQRVLDRILEAGLADALAGHRAIYRARAPLMRYLTDIGADVPSPFLLAAEVVLNDELRRALSVDEVDTRRVQELLDDAARWDVELDTPGLARTLTDTTRRLTEDVARRLTQPRLFRSFGRIEASFFDRIRELVKLARRPPFEIELWEAQNAFYDALQAVYPGLVDRAAGGDEIAEEWVDNFRLLGADLGVATTSPDSDAGPDAGPDAGNDENAPT